MIKALIIDDLEQARTTLKKDLSIYAKDIEVIGEAEGVVSGANCSELYNLTSFS